MTTENALLGEEAASRPDHKVAEVSRSICFYQRSNFNDATSVQPQPSDNPYDSKAIEQAVIIKDVSSDSPAYIPSSSAVVPHIQDVTSNEIQTSRETKEEIEPNYKVAILLILLVSVA